MEMSIIEQVMLDRILSKQNKLSDFYDIFSFDIIEKEVEEICDEKKIKSENKTITLLDIMIVGNYLLADNQLSKEELVEFVNHISYDFPKNVEYQEYIDVLDSITDSIKADVNELNIKIKMMKSRDKNEKQEINITKKKKEMIAKQEDLIVSKGYFKITLEEMQKIKKNLLQKTNPFRSKKYLLWKKHLKMTGENDKVIVDKKINPEVEKMKEQLNMFASLIEDNQLTLEEMVTYVYGLSSLGLKDEELRISVKNIISKIKSKICEIDANLKKTKKQVKNLIIQEMEFSQYKYLDLSLLGDLMEERNGLKNLLEILNNVKKHSLISSTNLRYIVSSNTKKALQEKKDKSLNRLKQNLYDLDYFDEDIDGSEVMNILGTENEKQNLLIIRENTVKAFENYEPHNPINAFFISSFDPNYVYSVENVRGKTVVRMHVQNIYPYLSSKTKSFLYSDFFKSLSDDYQTNKFLLDHCQETYKFSDGIIRPTIAYTFIFDEYLHFESFNIEKMDAKIRNAKEEELKCLSDIFNKNRDNERMIDLYFQRLLLDESIKYFKENNIPVLLFSKPNDEYRGDHSKMRKKGSEVLNTKNQERMAEILNDVDRNTFDSIGAKLYKNYRKKHLSMTFDDNCDYRIDELAILEPFSFLGSNLEKLINMLVFDKKDNIEEVREYIQIEQQKYISMFNGLCKYIEEDELIDIVEKSYQYTRKNQTS